MFSKKLNSAQRRYTVMEKELYAILKSLEHFKTIIFNTDIKIYTDNANLKYNSAAGNSRTQRWKLLLNEYNFEIIHLKGIENAASDFLSRNFTIIEKQKKDNEIKNIHERVPYETEIYNTLKKHVYKDGKLIIPLEN